MVNDSVGDRKLSRKIKPMETTEDLQKKYCSRAIFIAIILGFCFIIFGYNQIGKGIVLGTIFSIINFVLIRFSLPSIIGRSKAKSFALSLGYIFLRFGLMAAPLYIAIKFDQINLFAVVGGLFAIQLVILCDHLTGFLFSKNK